MTVIAFDPTAFRAMFSPRFDNTQCFSDTVLAGWWTIAGSTVSNQDCSCYALTGADRVQACNLMTAHIGFIFGLANAGQPSGIVTEATIDKVRVSVLPPPVKDSMFAWWLAQSPYGQMLLAMLAGAAAGGAYIGGLPERDGFRRVYGGFNGPYGGGCW